MCWHGCPGRNLPGEYVLSRAEVARLSAGRMPRPEAPMLGMVITVNVHGTQDPKAVLEAIAAQAKKVMGKA